jgi:hypothetical protein
MLYFLFFLISSVIYIFSSELPPRAIIRAQPAHNNRFVYTSPRTEALSRVIPIPAIVDLIQDFAQDADLDRQFEQAVVIGNSQLVRENVDKLSQRIPEKGVIRRIHAFLANEDMIPYKDYRRAARLIKNGVSQNSLNRALFAVIAQPDVAAVRFLLHYGAKSNCKDNNGDTPLIATLKIENPETIILMVEALLSYGADPAHINNQRQSFLSILKTKSYSPNVLQNLHEICEHQARKRIPN